MDIKANFSDQFVSVEHLVLALAQDTHFGEGLLKQEGVSKEALEQVQFSSGHTLGNYRVSPSIITKRH